MHFSNSERGLTFIKNPKRSIKLLNPIETPLPVCQLTLDTPTNAIDRTRKIPNAKAKKVAKNEKKKAPPQIAVSDDEEASMSKKTTEILTVARADGIIITPIKDPLLRISQLEQNIRFLQEQHQTMLSGLHNEIETLRQRNRDLQFQLVFTKGGVVLSTPSSPEDDSKHKLVNSKQNVTPIQVEFLEKEIAELKINLQDSNKKNSYLSAIVEEQKQKLETYETQWQSISSSGPSQQELELRQKVEDADRLIRRLKRENEDQRREITTIRSTFSANESFGPPNRDYSQQQGRNNHGNNGSGNSGRRGNHHRGREHRFPPLHTQSFWHQSNGRGNGGRGLPRADSEGSGSGTTLPSLHAENQDPVGYPATYTTNTGNGNRRSGNNYQGNGNHQYRDGERKYRGQNRGNKL